MSLTDDIDMEASQLLDDLYKTQKTLKAGSIEREEKEDFIFKRLYQIAEVIKTQDVRDQKLRELYQLITNEQLPDQTVMQEYNGILPIYSDRYQLFTRYPAHPNTYLFLKELVKSIHQDADIESIMNNPSQDGAKELLYSLVSNCQRMKGLENAQNSTCSRCYDQAMKQIFFMVAEMLTVELQSRSEQILNLLHSHELTRQDGIELQELMSHMISVVQKMVKSLDNHIEISKSKWIEIIESMYRLIVNLINEVLMRYMITSKVRGGLVDGRSKIEMTI